MHKINRIILKNYEKNPSEKNENILKAVPFDFTGERLIPNRPELENLYQEHIIRYMYASKFVKSKIVLDAGCGTGYGTFLLSERDAKKVIGIDISDDAIDFCKNNYKRENLEFKRDDITNCKFDNAAFDLVTAFEVIEHLENPDSFVKEMRRVLKNDGLFILSTPNKLTYPAGNPFHILEFNEEELKSLLERNFKYVNILYQSYPPTLAIYKSGQLNKINEFDINNKTISEDGKSSLYFVAICSNEKLVDSSGMLFLFNNKTMLLKNYSELQRWIKVLQKDLKDQIDNLRKLQKEFDERTAWALKLENQIKDKDSQINELQKEFEKRTAWSLDPDKLIQTKDSQIMELQKQLEEHRKDVNEIRSSAVYGIVSSILSILNKIAPESTRRNNALRLASAAYLLKKERGTMAVIGAIKDKITQKRLLSLKPSEKPSHEFYLKKFESKANFDSNVLQIKEKTEPDFHLNRFLEFGAHNIINLQNFPKISIIIITYNQVEALRRNLYSIKSKTTYQNYEIILVTNNKDENSEMRKFLKTLKDSVFIYQDEYSFGGMNNFGASKASGDYLLILNDDMEVLNPNWLESFLSLALDKEVGAVGGKLLFSNGKVQDCGGIVWKNANAWNYGRFHAQNDVKLNYVRDVDYVTGACLFVKKEIFDKVGGFDLQYNPAYWEDVDLCFSIRKLGLRVLYQPLASLIHYEGMTQGTDTAKGIKSFQIVNKEKFEEKWKEELKNRLEDSDSNSFFERDRRDGLNILYIDHYVPEPDKDSGSLRTFNMISILSYMNNKITFWPDNLKNTIPYVPELQQKGVEVIHGRKNFDRFLDERKHLYDIAILTRPYIAVKYIDKIKKKMPNCKIIFDTTDLHFLRMERQSAIEKGHTSSQAQIMKKLEMSLIKKSDITILTSPVEAQVLHKENEDFKFAILPNVHVDMSKNVESFEKRKNIMFVGSFNHPPNIDAMKYFVSDIWSKIKEKIPDVELFIVGSNPTPEIKKMSSKDVIVTGFVKDLQPFYDECRLMIAPLRYGAGIKGKITQSLAKGLPVITTSVGAEGIDLEDGKNCMIADKAEEFAEKTIMVYNDEKLWLHLSSGGIEIAQNYSAEKAQACFEAIFANLFGADK